MALASLLVLVGVTFACRKENGDTLTLEWLWNTIRVACFSIYCSFRYSMSPNRPTHRRLRYQKYNGRLSNPETVWPDGHTKSSLAEGRSKHASAIESAIVLWRWRRPSRALSQLWTHRPPLWAHIMQQTKACHSLACPKDWFSREFNRLKMRCNKHHNDGVKMHHCSLAWQV